LNRSGEAGGSIKFRQPRLKRGIVLPELDGEVDCCGLDLKLVQQIVRLRGASPHCRTEHDVRARIPCLCRETCEVRPWNAARNQHTVQRQVHVAMRSGSAK